VEGPFELRSGHRFEREKVLLDPYARSVHFPPDMSRRAACLCGPNDGRAPLGVIHACRDHFDWGYMTLNFFSPEQSYGVAGGDAVAEFRGMVKALHEAGIEVIVDVAYSHTTESDENGPTYSFRGIDNSTYYLLHDDRRWYRNDSGCGNVLHTANAATRKLVLDSMRYWLYEMHVDGFRFDLASIFSRKASGQTQDIRRALDPEAVPRVDEAPSAARAREGDRDRKRAAGRRTSGRSRDSDRHRAREGMGRAQRPDRLRERHRARPLTTEGDKACSRTSWFPPTARGSPAMPRNTP